MKFLSGAWSFTPPPFSLPPREPSEKVRLPRQRVSRLCQWEADSLTESRDFSKSLRTHRQSKLTRWPSELTLALIPGLAEKVSGLCQKVR